MQLHFINIPYAVTLPDGELVDDSYLGHDPLICEFCGVSMTIRIEPDGAQYYQHVLTGTNAIAKASQCIYRHDPDGGQQRYHTLKSPGHTDAIPPWVSHRPPYRTVVRNWRCQLCRHRYFGNKQCPRCHDWACTVEA